MFLYVWAHVSVCVFYWKSTYITGPWNSWFDTCFWFVWYLRTSCTRLRNDTFLRKQFFGDFTQLITYLDIKKWYSWFTVQCCNYNQRNIEYYSLLHLMLYTQWHHHQTYSHRSNSTHRFLLQLNKQYCHLLEKSCGAAESFSIEMIKISLQILWKAGEWFQLA